jgi:hypothetical protein
MMRHFKECITTGVRPVVGTPQALVLMQIMDAIYRSAETGRSIEIRTASTPPAASPDPSPALESPEE